jgi:hypothetical protein
VDPDAAVRRARAGRRGAPDCADLEPGGAPVRARAASERSRAAVSARSAAAGCARPSTLTHWLISSTVPVCSTFVITEAFVEYGRRATSRAGRFGS